MFSHARTNCHGSTVRCLYARPLFETAKRDCKSMLRANVLGFGIVNLWVIPCLRMLNQLTASREILLSLSTLALQCKLCGFQVLKRSVDRLLTYLAYSWLHKINIGSNTHPIQQVGRTWPQFFFTTATATLCPFRLQILYCVWWQYAPVNQIFHDSTTANGGNGIDPVEWKIQISAMPSR